ncbi:RNA-binding protein Vip1 [Schizosaccharomyces japonicus yFS275]|uniref:RNA-binding protein Vip1 n=1 Tax=Schizosaccharomyces japonicus (strain yFS275 / FY16936) TaxID=402676 RepID=B6K8E3_SCHJY|nr:RNA-binding protein Vip1 [Schizosaccharomyces japonicus yFS275]EEB09797.1 RNA-binding protein Vip1 [Schizosaccharomyces japonicus yFS275]
MSSNCVVVHNISNEVTEKQISDFFSFCGKVADISLKSEGTTQTATIEFERASATKTALLLQDAVLGTNRIQVVKADSSKGSVSSSEEGTPSDTATTQEEKPRAAIFAELLSRGYHLSDVTIEKGLELDQKHGVSSRFKGLLESALAGVKNMDARYHVSEKANEIDNKLSISNRFHRTAAFLNGYIQRAMDTNAGQKVQSAFNEGRSHILGIHNEARRLADLKAGKTVPDATTAKDETLGAAAVEGEKATKATTAESALPAAEPVITSSGTLAEADAHGAAEKSEKTALDAKPAATD